MRICSATMRMRGRPWRPFPSPTSPTIPPRNCSASSATCSASTSPTIPLQAFMRALREGERNPRLRPAGNAGPDGSHAGRHHHQHQAVHLQKERRADGLLHPGRHDRHRRPAPCSRPPSPQPGSSLEKDKIVLLRGKANHRERVREDDEGGHIVEVLAEAITPLGSGGANANVGRRQDRHQTRPVQARQ